MALLGDSTAVEGALQPELTEAEQKALEKQQEYENDPHRPEYYLKDIPFTEEQMKASNAKLVDGLYNSGIIYKDLMENLPLAEKTFMRICNDFPDFEHLDETYYNMYQLYSRFGYRDEAATYREKLMAEYPDNEHTKLIADPNFEFKGRYATSWKSPAEGLDVLTRQKIPLPSLFATSMKGLTPSIPR